MTTYRINQDVRHLPTGSVGKVRLWMKAGVYLVVFEAENWQGDKKLVKSGKVKMQVGENDMEAV